MCCSCSSAGANFSIIQSNGWEGRLKGLIQSEVPARAKTFFSLCPWRYDTRRRSRQASVVDAGEGGQAGGLRGGRRREVSGKISPVSKGAAGGRDDEVRGAVEVASRGREEMQVRGASGGLEEARETAARGGRQSTRD